MAVDIKTWFRYEWKKNIPVMLIFLCAAVSSVISSGEADIGIREYMITMFKGVKPYENDTVTGREVIFNLPAYYLLFNMYIAWVVGYFPFKDMSGYGKISLIKYKSRQRIWINKCIWCICAVSGFYISGYMVFMIMDLAGPFIKSVKASSVMETELEFASLDNYKMCMLCIVIPLLTSIGISVLQMAVSIFIKPVYGVIAVMGVLVLSVSYCKWFFPGNSLMLLRSSSVIGKSGVGMYMGMFMGICMLMSGIIAGLVLIRKKDII